MSRFDGSRVYNGCPDDTLQTKLNEYIPFKKKALKICPTLFSTFFPMEGMYSVSSREPVGKFGAYETISFCNTNTQAWIAAIEQLKKMRIK